MTQESGSFHPSRIRSRGPEIADHGRLDRGALVAPAARRRRPADRGRLVQGAQYDQPGCPRAPGQGRRVPEVAGAALRAGGPGQPAEDDRLRPARGRGELPGQGGQEPAGRLLARRRAPGPDGVRPADLRHGQGTLGRPPRARQHGHRLPGPEGGLSRPALRPRRGSLRPLHHQADDRPEIPSPASSRPSPTTRTTSTGSPPRARPGSSSTSTSWRRTPRTPTVRVASTSTPWARSSRAA